jgi:hypothetical protein
MLTTTLGLWAYSFAVVFARAWGVILTERLRLSGCETSLPAEARHERVFSQGGYAFSSGRSYGVGIALLVPRCSFCAGTSEPFSLV